jgi:hypothetical protein
MTQSNFDGAPLTKTAPQLIRPNANPNTITTATTIANSVVISPIQELTPNPEVYQSQIRRAIEIYQKWHFGNVQDSIGGIESMSPEVRLELGIRSFMMASALFNLLREIKYKEIPVNEVFTTELLTDMSKDLWEPERFVGAISIETPNDNHKRAKSTRESRQAIIDQTQRFNLVEFVINIILAWKDDGLSFNIDLTGCTVTNHSNNLRLNFSVTALVPLAINPHETGNSAKHKIQTEWADKFWELYNQIYTVVNTGKRTINHKTNPPLPNSQHTIPYATLDLFNPETLKKVRSTAKEILLNI